MTQELKRIGADMANVMFNLAQRAGEPITAAWAATMVKLRKEWDEAVRTTSPSPASDAELPPEDAWERDAEKAGLIVNGLSVSGARTNAFFSGWCAGFARAASTRTASEPLGYAMFRNGKQVGIEPSKELAANWVNAEAVPLGCIASTASDTRTAALEEAARLCDAADKSEHPSDLADRIRALAAGEAECDAALGRAAPAGQHDATLRAKFGPQGDDPVPEWFYLLHAAAETLDDNGCTANAESVREIAALLLWSPYQQGAVIVDERELTELRERLNLASILGEPITLSHNAAFALYIAMSTGIPATAEQMGMAGPACQGGNTQPVSVESATTQVEQLQLEVDGLKWAIKQKELDAEAAARTQADAGKEKDAARWRAFRARDEFESLDFTAFQDQFREDADKIIDDAMLSGAQIAEGE